MLQPSKYVELSIFQDRNDTTRAINIVQIIMQKSINTCSAG